MLRRMKLISMIIVATLVTGCNDGEIIELPELQNKIVLWSVNNVDNVWYVSLSQSLPVLDEAWEYKGIPNATVSLFEDGKLLLNLECENTNSNELSRFTTSLYKPVAGRTYEIIASAPGFETASATYTQPILSPQIDDFKIKGKAVEFFQDRVDAEITLTDLPGENFYELSIQASNSRPETANVFAGMNAFGADLQSLGGVGLGAVTFTDESFQGKTITIKFSAYESPNGNLKVYTVYVRSVSRDYYDCIKTLSRQDALGRDPYATPLRVKGNIKNGFGLFTGYSQSHKSVEVD
jgi:Domain of unknown function (DUF4249)